MYKRQKYLDQEGTVVYTGKDRKTNKVFPALEWLAAMCSHIPNRGEQMVRYYGYYSNVSRGKRQKEGNDDAVPCILEPQEDVKAFRKSWARLIQKIYEVDPLICPKCKGTMRVISSIEDQSVIRAILEYLGLNWYSYIGHLEKSDIGIKLLEVRDDSEEKELFEAI